MNITINIPAEIITALRLANDPEREVWKDDSELSADDVADMVNGYLESIRED